MTKIMKPRIYILLFLVNFGLGNIAAQNRATEEIKDAITIKFSKWLEKSKFETNVVYEARMKTANEKLKEISSEVIDSIKSKYLERMRLIGRYADYNADDECFLIKIRQAAFFKTNDQDEWSSVDYTESDSIQNIVLKIDPAIAKAISSENSDRDNILIVPNKIARMNDQWMVTDALIIIDKSSYIDDIDPSLKIIQKDGDIYLSYSRYDVFKAIDLTDRSNLKLFGNNLFGDHSYYYYKWKITDQPQFNPASVQPITLSLEDLNITLPTSNRQ